MPLPLEMDVGHRRLLVGGEPMVFRCHHYNAFLLQVFLDAPFLEAGPLLEGAAAAVAYAQLTRVFAAGKVSDIEARKSLAQELFRWSGFGAVDLSSLGPQGGTVKADCSYEARAWRVKQGKAGQPVCFFTAGWLAGAWAALFGRSPDRSAVVHSRCAASGQSELCAFDLSDGRGHPLPQTVGAGPLQPCHEPRPVPPTPVDYEGILAAVAGLPLVGDAHGQIDAFGVHLTRTHANYYNRICFELLRNATGKFGAEGRTCVEALLLEAGHSCAFYTFGGIMTSAEWDALIRPSLKTREDWVHGAVAVANAFGWGRWQVTYASAEHTTFVIHDDYEGVGYLAMYGEASRPVELGAQGAALGLMNLVYVGEIHARPALTPALYDQLFKQPPRYACEVVTSRAMGDEVTTLNVSRVNN